ncbi:cell division cycle protein 20 homolog [Brevipalpus obovatus]|uniref:cell division cycle protein 20 homolog n=1 Tax=Brevipalpus obovatus TaxID=246614 RepID=UPI003D9F9DFD
MSTSINQSLLHSFSSFQIASDDSVLKRSMANMSLKTPKTPHNRSGILTARTPNKTPMGGDRFIPNRSFLDQDRSYHMITKSDLTSKENQGSRPREQQNNNNTLDDVRVLPFGEKSLSKFSESYTSFSRSVKKNRPLPERPDKILDAPDVKDDFYLQLMDWSDKNLLAVALNRAVYIWDPSICDAKLLMEVPEGQFVSSVSWSVGAKNSAKIAIGTSGAEVQIWDLVQQKRLRKMKGHRSRITSLSWDSWCLSCGCRDGSIIHHDVRQSQHKIGEIQGHNHDVCGLEWSPNNHYLASGGNDNIINIWPGRTAEKPQHTFNTHTAAVKALAWNPWQPNILASGGGSADKTIKLWNINTGANLLSLDTGSQVSALLWNERHQELVSAHGAPSNNLIVWKYNQNSEFTELTEVGKMHGHGRGDNRRILGLSMNPDGRTIVSLSADETLRFWDCFPADTEKRKSINCALSGKIR